LYSCFCVRTPTLSPSENEITNTRGDIRVINLFAVGTYGEAEFWLSGGKVVLIFILFFFTFITMVGGNPKGDKYGFRYWSNPGAFAESHSTGDLGRFEGFLGALWIAIFTCVGPEYISMVSAESKHPRIYIKSAFKTVYWRFGIFFIGGAICVGVVIAYNDVSLVEAITSGKSSSAASPYIIAMQNMGITGLPDLCSALMVTSVFSAGNTYTYAATRALHGLAINGRAPRFLTYTTKKGVPLYCFIVVMAFSFLSLLQISGGAYKVLNWLISLTTANILIDYIIIMVTYICYHRACNAQGFDRSKLPYVGYLQPYCGYIGLVWFIVMLFCFGYRSFTPWDTAGFFLNYTMLIFSPACFIFWKLWKKTRWLRPLEVDLKWEADAITAYEESEEEQPTSFWRDMLRMVDFRRIRSSYNSSAPA
jgi:amino acid transporter